MNPREALRKYFGHDAFRPGQEELVQALMDGRDALGVMPTGAGKSMCYQVPALLKDGITLVISPLISLMADQVAALRSAGVPAAYLNSSLSPRQMELATQRAWQSMYKIIYVAPERLEVPSFIEFARAAKISLIAVDEAHCVSQWGQDFRPVYLRIADFVDSLPVRPVMGAFTATATQRVREDIIRLLRLRSPEVASTGFDRPNLYFEIVQPKDRYTTLSAILRQKRGEASIVYCATRKAVEDVTRRLQAEGFSAGRYHAGLSDEERRQSQEDFQYDRLQIMVATNAFGMGIDKSNVRSVIHYNMPRSMEAYYQEAGRAGRDGEKAECILLYSGQDIFTARWMIDHGDPNPDLSALEQSRVRQMDHQRLQSMIDYCTKPGCQRRFILRYFGDPVLEDCGDCGWCTGGRYGGEAAIARPAKVKKPVAPVKVEPIKIDASGITEDLFEQLRSVRMSLARKEKVPPYIICADTTLNDMVRRMPRTKAGLKTIKGMGDVKVEKYGDAFLQVINAYAKSRQQVRSAGEALARRAQTNLPEVHIPSVFDRIPERETQREERIQYDLDDYDQLQYEYLSGHTIAELARMFDTEPGEIRRRLQEMDLIF